MQFELSHWRCHRQISRSCISNLSCNHFNQSCSSKGKITLALFYLMRQNRHYHTSVVVSTFSLCLEMHLDNRFLKSRSRSRRSQVSSRSRKISVSVSSSLSRDFAQVIFYEVLQEGVPLKIVLKNDCSKFSHSKRSVANLSMLLCCFRDG